MPYIGVSSDLKSLPTKCVYNKIKDLCTYTAKPEALARVIYMYLKYKSKDKHDSFRNKCPRG